MTLADVQLKWSVILMDRLGPDIFTKLLMKAGTWFELCECAFKSSGLITCLECSYLYMFLSPLNEINGGCEKILPESGSFWSNLKFFRMMDFTAWNVKVNGIQSFFWDVCSVDYVPISLLGAMMSRLNNRSRIATYVEEIAHSSSDFKKNQSPRYKDDEV